MIALFLSISCLLMNFDHGALPAALVDMRKDLKFSKVMMGSLGSYVYAGFVVGSIVNATIFDSYCTNKFTLSLAFILNGVGALLYINNTEYYILSFARFMSGFGQIIVSIYIPIFVDTFCSVESKAVWLPVVAICGPLGACLGYSLTGSLLYYEYNWTIAFFMLSVSMAAGLVVLILIPGSYLNVDEVDHII